MDTPIGDIIGRGAVADVFAAGEGRALKLYHAGRMQAQAFIEAAILSLVAGHGLPVPKVYEAGEYNGRWGLVMDRVAGRTLGDLCLAGDLPAADGLGEMVSLQQLLHGVAETRLRSLRERLATNIGLTPLLDDRLKGALLARLSALPDGNRLCHGDFHPFNIIGSPGRTTIIDWLDATTGAPAADACRSYLLLRQGAPDLAEPYLRGYAAASGTAAADILAWLPCVAAARLNEGVASEAASLVAMAEAV